MTTRWERERDSHLTREYSTRRSSKWDADEDDHDLNPDVICDDDLHNGDISLDTDPPPTSCKNRDELRASNEEIPLRKCRAADDDAIAALLATYYSPTIHEIPPNIQQQQKQKQKQKQTPGLSNFTNDETKLQYGSKSISW